MPPEMLDLQPPPAIITGYATHYARGLMQVVYANRLLFRHVTPCAECVDFAAMIDRADLGKRIRVRNVATGEVSPVLLVIDCAASHDIDYLRQRGIVVEVSWEQAQLWGMTGPIAVEVEYVTD